MILLCLKNRWAKYSWSYICTPLKIITWSPRTKDNHFLVLIWPFSYSFNLMTSILTEKETLYWMSWMSWRREKNSPWYKTYNINGHKTYLNQPKDNDTFCNHLKELQWPNTQLKAIALQYSTCKLMPKTFSLTFIPKGILIDYKLLNIIHPDCFCQVCIL